VNEGRRLACSGRSGGAGELTLWNRRRRGKGHISGSAGSHFTGNVLPGRSRRTKELRCVVGGVVPQANDRVCLRPLLTLNDVEFDVVPFFERLVAFQLNRGVMDEYIGPVITSNESVALGVIEPLHLTFVLSHRLPPSLHREKYTAAERQIQTLGGRYLFMTAETWLRLVARMSYLFKSWDGERRELGSGNREQRAKKRTRKGSRQGGDPGYVLLALAAAKVIVKQHAGEGLAVHDVALLDLLDDVRQLDEAELDVLVCFGVRIAGDETFGDVNFH
jgi:hypothetical protein